MIESKGFSATFPQDDILLHYIKLLAKELKGEGFELAMEHHDPNGIDVFTYRSKEGKQTVSLSRCSGAKDQQELRITSEWDGLKQVVTAAAKRFSDEILNSLEEGLQE